MVAQLGEERWNCINRIDCIGPKGLRGGRGTSTSCTSALYTFTLELSYVKTHRHFGRVAKASAC